MNAIPVVRRASLLGFRLANNFPGAGAVRQIDRTEAGMSAKYRAAIASMRRGAMLPIDEKTI